MFYLNDSTFNGFIQQNPNRPILIMFTSTNCGPCKQIYPILEGMSTLMNVAKIDTSLSPILTDYFDIMTVPTLLLIYNGQEIRRSGFLGTQKQILDFVKY